MQLQSTNSAQQQSSPSVSIADAYEAWTLDLQARRCTPATLTHYRDFLAPFVRWLESQQPQTVTQITPTHLRRYLTDLQARNRAGHTILGYFRDIRAWLRSCVAEGWLVESPAANELVELDDVFAPYKEDPHIGFLPVWGTIMAGSVLATVPIIIIFVAFQDKFMSSVVVGAVKE
jgi:hypothetical protein